MTESLQFPGQDQIADLTECSICSEVFTNPKSLPCIHTFCLKCLKTYGKDFKPGQQMSCPICRNIFVIPDKGFDSLPSNFFIGKLVEIRKLATTATSEVLCATCPEEERTKATMFCFECEQNFCERCAASHKKLKLCQNHQVVEIGKQLKPQEVNSRNSYCDQHPDELVKMYCEDDKATICILCFAESHQTHKCVSVTKASVEFSAALRNHLSVVKGRLLEYENSKEKLKKLQTGLLANIAEAEQEISNEAARLKALIDKHAHALTQNLTEIKEKKMKEIENVKQDVERFQAMIESYANYSEELLSRGAPGDICRAANQMKTKAQELVALPAICCGCESCSCEITFKSSNLADVLRINNIANVIGDVQTNSSIRQPLGHVKTVPSKSQVIEVATLQKRRRTIIVKGITADVSTDHLRMFFENRLHGGGEIDDFDCEKGNGTAIITFKKLSVADAWVFRGFILFNRKHLPIVRWSASNLPRCNPTSADS